MSNNALTGPLPASLKALARSGTLYELLVTGNSLRDCSWFDNDNVRFPHCPSGAHSMH